MGYSTSDAFFEALWEAGVKHVFVNLGTDHPSIIEAIVKGKKTKEDKFPKIFTCPNEMVALAMADGYARLTGKPQCVLVHVDVGTQGLAAAVHDASTGRCPVLIFAGLSPFTLENELPGSRTEYIHWIQDVPDQKQIISQYCRYTAEVKTGRNIKQMVNRALSFAMSDPKGPVHLVAAREILTEQIEPYYLNQDYWTPIEPSALPEQATELIATALVAAQEPLLVTGYCGRNHATVPELVKLANAIPGLRVLDSGGSDMCFPANHPAWLGLRYGVDKSIQTADVILLLDCDTPWIPTQCQPKEDARVFHIDIDPLKQLMPVFYLKALKRYRADSFTALRQINHYIASDGQVKETLSAAHFKTRQTKLIEAHDARLTAIRDLAVVTSQGSYGAAYLASKLRQMCPADTIWVIEAVTVTGFVADQLQCTLPGSWINCGGGGLGWSGGAALGIKLATSTADSPFGDKKPRFVCQIVGDGTYMFSVPSSVYWISQRYSLPILTVVLNNQGWHAPKRSMLLVHPDGLASQSSHEDMNISFAPTPDYSGIAKAAAGGRLWAGIASDPEQLEDLLPKAVKSVESGIGAVLDAHLDGPTGKYMGGVAASSG